MAASHPVRTHPVRTNPQPATEHDSAEKLRRRLSSEDRKQQLLEHAIELFSQHGFSGTRTKDIAAACGVSEGILFRHFSTKEDLYHAILDSHEGDCGTAEWMAEMERLAEAGDDEGFIRDLITSLLRSFREEATFHRLMVYARLEGHSLAEIFHARMGAPAVEFLTRYIKRRQQEGVFRSGDAHTLVLMLFAAPVQYGMMRYLFQRDRLNSSEDEVVGTMVPFLLAGLRKDATMQDATIKEATLQNAVTYHAITNNGSNHASPNQHALPNDTQE